MWDTGREVECQVYWLLNSLTFTCDRHDLGFKSKNKSQKSLRRPLPDSLFPDWESNKQDQGDGVNWTDDYSILNPNNWICDYD
jgi:hypothetical protein